MTTPTTAAAPVRAVRLVLSGRVQGVGVRPAVARLARELRLRGSVSNEALGVVAHVEGDQANVAAFLERIAGALPPAAQLAGSEWFAADVRGAADFQVAAGGGGGRLATPPPRDLAVCDDCLREIADCGNRRAGDAFASCTNCGPRYAILERMPYERSDTSMRAFALCPQCHGEFHAPDNRRFHAQTIACPDCGPTLTLLSPAGPLRLPSAEAIARSAAALGAGDVVALLGLGGFQLLCDAANRAAVERLRRRKDRPVKPFAVLVNREAAEWFTAADRAAFLDPVNPIVVLSPESAAQLRAVRDSGGASGAAFGFLDNPLLAPGLQAPGLLRATTPLHALLLKAVGRPLVLTSGNVEGDPLAFDGAACGGALAALADLVLTHDRRVVRPIDDSVVRVIADRVTTIRAARGLAPLPLNLSLAACAHSAGPASTGKGPGFPAMLAVGGQQKAAVAISNGRQCLLGPHLGDLDSLAARERWLQQTQQLLELYGAAPAAIVCDLHPDYFTAQWAAAEAESRRIPLIRVQHHHAHIAAGMLELGWLRRTVLGVAFDGTGAGDDGAAWGGEFLKATATGFQRVASLRPFPLIGGALAIREPWRIAAALVAQALPNDDPLELLGAIAPAEDRALLSRLVRRASGPVCTSAGRLFDGAAALILGAGRARCEGELALRLENACEPTQAPGYDLPLDHSSPALQLDWRPLIRQIVADRRAAQPPGKMATRFHRALADGVAAVAGAFAELPVVLGGGCFQNRALTELIAERLRGRPAPLGLPGAIPPNDGGLAAGQLAVGLSLLAGGRGPAAARDGSAAGGAFL